VASLVDPCPTPLVSCYARAVTSYDKDTQPESLPASANHYRSTCVQLLIFDAGYTKPFHLPYHCQPSMGFMTLDVIHTKGPGWSNTIYSDRVIASRVIVNAVSGIRVIATRVIIIKLQQTSGVIKHPRYSSCVQPYN